MVKKGGFYMNKFKFRSLVMSLIFMGSSINSNALEIGVYNAGLKNKFDQLKEPKIINTPIKLKKNLIDIRFDKLKKEKKENQDIELVFIIDRSGSMYESTKKVIEGFNDLISKQKAIKDGKNVRLTTVIFNTKHRTLHNHVDIQGISCITKNDYKPKGGTALLDAVGSTISHIDDKNGKRDVMCIIMTDGLENSSREFSRDAIKKLIEEKQNQGNWKFTYYLSGIDFDERSDIGISLDDTVCCESAAVNREVFGSIMGDSCRKISRWRSSHV